MNTLPLPRLLSRLPARHYSGNTIYLPRLLVIGGLITGAGIYLAFQHTPGTLSLTDLLATAISALGMSAIALGIMPRDTEPPRPVLRVLQGGAAQRTAMTRRLPAWDEQAIALTIEPDHPRGA